MYNFWCFESTAPAALIALKEPLPGRLLGCEPTHFSDRLFAIRWDDFARFEKQH